MGRVTATLSGILVLALLAGGLTEATLALGHHGGIADDAKLRPQSSVTPTPTPSPSSSSTPSPAATLAATPTPVATPVLKTAVTNSFVRIRAGKSTTSAIMYELNGGTVVGLLPGGDSTWQQVSYQGSIGYIYRTYLTY